SSSGSNNYFLTTLIVIGVIVLIAVIVQVADNLLRIEAKETGAEKSGANYSLFPGVGELFRPKLPDYVNGNPVAFLKQGHDILLEGEAHKEINESLQATTFAVQPPDFIGISPIPKVLVEKGDEVKAGDSLFFDKKRPDILYSAPVSGEVVDIIRGAKRSIAQVVILADKEQKHREFEGFDLANGSREDLVAYLMKTGLWTMICQRPFDVVPEASDKPKAVFITTFDSAPLAPDLNFVVEGKGAAFQKGLDVLNKLVLEGKVHLGLSARGESAPSDVFLNAENVEKHWFHGPHPSGNVGVQIHHIDPISAGEKVWTLGVQEVISLGNLFLENRYDASRVVAITGAELEKPTYVNTFIGANIADLTKGQIKGEKTRFISGDVLSGKQVGEKGFLSFHDDQLTTIEEGDNYELFGWLIPIAPRPSISRTFPNFLYSDYKFTPDTNTHGEKRAFVVTGQYEQVLPMDIYPQHLMKAIMINDFERMEGLGIYELSEEDVALCEFVCTSKQPLQQILREGLDVMREQS
ncbi:MAG: Na(+)-translocating NADH-quinone reductase subunit A, partial [Bacteroidota bacterium]